VQITLGRSAQAETSPPERQPTWWEPGMTRSGPLPGWLSSRCSRTVNISAITDAGGCTWRTPALIDHGPNCAKFFRSRTAMVRSWCQTTFQLESAVLLNKIPRTAKDFLPRTLSTSCRTGFETANARTAGTSNRFLCACLDVSSCEQRSSTTCWERHWGTTANPFSSILCAWFSTAPAYRSYVVAVIRLLHQEFRQVREVRGECAGSAVNWEYLTSQVSAQERARTWARAGPWVSPTACYFARLKFDSCSIGQDWHSATLIGVVRGGPEIACRFASEVEQKLFNPVLLETGVATIT